MALAAVLLAAGCSGTSSSTELGGGGVTSTTTSGTDDLAPDDSAPDDSAIEDGSDGSSPTTVTDDPETLTDSSTPPTSREGGAGPGSTQASDPAASPTETSEPANTTPPPTTIDPPDTTPTTLPVFAPPTTIEPLPPVGSNADLRQGGVCPLLDDRSVTDAFGTGITVGESGTDEGEIVCRWHGGDPAGDRVIASADDPLDDTLSTEQWADHQAAAGARQVKVGESDGRVQRFGNGAQVNFEGLDMTTWTVSVVHPDGPDKAIDVALDVARRML